MARSKKESGGRILTLSDEQIVKKRGRKIDVPATFLSRYTTWPVNLREAHKHVNALMRVIGEDRDFVDFVAFIERDERQPRQLREEVPASLYGMPGWIIRPSRVEIEKTFAERRNHANDPKRRQPGHQSVRYDELLSRETLCLIVGPHIARMLALFLEERGLLRDFTIDVMLATMELRLPGPLRRHDFLQVMTYESTYYSGNADALAHHASRPGMTEDEFLSRVEETGGDDDSS